VDKLPASALTPHKPTLCTGSCGAQSDPNVVAPAPAGTDDGGVQETGQVAVSNVIPDEAGPDVQPAPDPSGGSARDGNGCEPTHMMDGRVNAAENLGPSDLVGKTSQQIRDLASALGFIPSGLPDAQGNFRKFKDPLRVCSD